VYKIATDGLREVSKFQIAQSPTWATPAIAGGRIIVKDRDSLTLWEIPKLDISTALTKYFVLVLELVVLD